MGYAAIPYAVAAISAGAQYANTQNTARKQDNALAQQIRDQMAQRQKSAQAITKSVQSISASSPDSARETALQGYLRAIQAHKDGAAGTMTTPGGTSQAFQQDAKSAAAGVQDYGDKVASLMASIDAPARQRQAEGVSIGDLAASLGRLRSDAQGSDFLNALRLRGIRRDPWLDAGAQFGMGWAQGKAGATT